MPTKKQIAANRENAKKSTGPNTDAGRAAVRLNALRHGLTAEAVVLPDENENEFDETRAAFEAEHNPVGPTENLLVQQVVVAAWRLRRIRLMSTGYVKFRLADTAERIEEDFDDPSHGLRLGYVAWQNGGGLELLARYETRVERSFYRALHELRRLQTARAARPAFEPPGISPADQSQNNPILNPVNAPNASGFTGILAHNEADRPDTRATPRRAAQRRRHGRSARVLRAAHPAYARQELLHLSHLRAHGRA